MKKYSSLLLLASVAAAPLFAASGDSKSEPFFLSEVPSPGINRDKNYNDTASYMDSQVQAQLRVDLDKETDAVHFIRDNNDPRVITKTYELKHAEPYALRSFLGDMVRTKRVAGSYTGVETIKYEDGTALLFVSAEEYRFKDHANGMGIDSIVERLDKPGILHSSGQPKYIYFPNNVPAKTLQTMVKNVGMNVSGDQTELIGGKDKVQVDPDLNCLFFNTASYSRKNIEEMLRKYDVPLPEIRIKFNVYELYLENDDKLGVDFQAWKNNEGVNLFSTGARFRDNWSATYGAGYVSRNAGSERTSFFNFNPKWNTRYLDFLTSKGKAKVAHSGELTVRQNTSSSFQRKTELFYIDLTVPAKENKLEEWVDKILNIMPAKHDTQETVTRNPVSFGFEMSVKTLTITPEAAVIDVKLKNSSLIGYQSSGAPRIQEGNEVSTNVMISTSRNNFVIGGLEKQEVVRGSAGVPFLKDIPVLGYLFQTESESTHKSQLVLTAECEYVYPESTSPDESIQKINEIRKETANAGDKNQFFFNQYLIDRR